MTINFALNCLTFYYLVVLMAIEHVDDSLTLFILYSVIPSVHVKLKSGQFPPWGSKSKPAWAKSEAFSGVSMVMSKHLPPNMGTTPVMESLKSDRDLTTVRDFLFSKILFS